jgi:hypothetical protein
MARAPHASSASSRRRSPGAGQRLKGFLAKRSVGRSLAWLALLGIAGIVVVNALILQKSRHPAPLLSGAASPQVLLPHQAATLRVETPRVIPLSAAESDPAALLAASPAATPQVMSVRPPPRQPGHAAPVNETAEARAHDAIAQLIGANGAGLAAGAAAPAIEDSRTIAAVQRALVKIGYVLRADGVMGTSTRQAIAQFERDRHLPVKGELSPRVRRELTVLSGIPID